MCFMGLDFLLYLVKENDSAKAKYTLSCSAFVSTSGVFKAKLACTLTDMFTMVTYGENFWVQAENRMLSVSSPMGKSLPPFGKCWHWPGMCQRLQALKSGGFGSEKGEAGSMGQNAPRWGPAFSAGRLVSA